MPEPVPGLLTTNGLSVYGRLPTIDLPPHIGNEPEDWTVRARRVGRRARLVDDVWNCPTMETTSLDPFEGVDEVLLGSYEIFVKGPVGVGPAPDHVRRGRCRRRPRSAISQACRGGAHAVHIHHHHRARTRCPSPAPSGSLLPTVNARSRSWPAWPLIQTHRPAAVHRDAYRHHRDPTQWRTSAQSLGPSLTSKRTPSSQSAYRAPPP